jgi:hypothetical protein
MIRNILLNRLNKNIIVNHIKNYSNGKIYRKLDYYELVLNQQCSNGYLQMLYTIAFDFNKDLYSNLDAVTNAIKIWQSQHPFLNCTVVNKDRVDHVQKRISFERYFVEILTDIDAKRLKNVLYLEYKSTTEDESNIWIKLNDLFLNYPIPHENVYLWRLIFIKLNKNRFCMIFNCHHDIGSGKTAHCLTKQLFSIIDSIFNNKSLTFEFYDIPASLETHLYNNCEKVIDNIRLPKEDIELNNKLFKLPKSIYEENQSNSILNLNGLLIDYDKNVASNFRTRDMPLNVVAEKFKFDKTITQKLLRKLKSNGVKPTGCFGAIISTAVYKAFKKYEIYQAEIIYAASVNLNQFLTEKLKPGQMGYYGTRAVNRIEATDLESILNSNDLETLWNVSKIESEKSMKMISAKRMLEYPKIRKIDIEKMSKIVDSEKGEDSYKVHFILSNIGSIETLPENIGGFKILDLYCETTTPKYGVNSHLFIAYLLITADELHIAFEISTALKREFRKSIIDSVRENVEAILK